MKQYIFAFLLSVFVLAFTNVTHADTTEYATISFVGLYDTGENACSIYDTNTSQMTSILECINYATTGMPFYIDVIGTCAYTAGSVSVNVGSLEPVYSTTVANNKYCFCKIVGPFTSNWVRHTGATFTTNLLCAANCGLACASLMETPDEYPDVVEELLYSLYR